MKYYEIEHKLYFIYLSELSDNESQENEKKLDEEGSQNEVSPRHREKSSKKIYYDVIYYYYIMLYNYDVISF